MFSGRINASRLYCCGAAAKLRPGQLGIRRIHFDGQVSGPSSKNSQLAPHCYQDSFDKRAPGVSSMVMNSPRTPAIVNPVARTRTPTL